MKKQLLLAALCCIGFVNANNVNDDDAKARAQREAAATAVDTLAALSRGGSRGIFEDAYDKIEQTLAPETQQELLKLEQRAMELHHKRETMLATGGFTENDEEIKKIDNNLEQITADLKYLMRHGGAINWRSLFAVGMGISMSMLAWRSTSDWLTRPKRTILTLLTVTITLEFLMRGRHAIVAGWTFRGMKELFKLIAKGIEKLFGTTGAGDKLLSTMEEQFRPISKHLEGKYAPAIAGLIVASTFALAFYVTSDKKGCSKKDKSPRKGSGKNAPPAPQIAV